MKQILIIDDEKEMLNSLNKLLSRYENFSLSMISDPDKAIHEVTQKKYDLIICDLKMKEYSGLDILKTTLKHFPGSKFIMISGYGTIEASVEAMKNGAVDFLEKPFASKKLFESVDRAISSEEAADNKSGETQQIDHHGIIYKSEKMQELMKLVRKVAHGNMNILLTGESGTGKELIAREIHRLGKGSKEVFVPVNCGALPEHLFESELFGHERGAFTGAVKTKPGLLEFANHGTFFFDEIGDLGQALQVKLLRMLEERKIRRVGGQNEIGIDVRIIAATNKDLEKEVAAKRFREDLYYRLNTIRIDIPPLRERREDIVPLARHFLTELCLREDKGERYFSPEAEESLLNYSWPGNVRELQNIIGRAYFLCPANVIQDSELPIPLSGSSKQLDLKILSNAYKEAKDLVIEKFEIDYLTYHLKQNNGNITKTAEECGLDRRTIHRLIKKYNIIYKDEE